MSDTLDQLCINTIRFLSVDAVQKAGSGHPGLPLGSAPMAYALWTGSPRAWRPTTGPLGQGFANAVGTAIVEAQLAARYIRPDCAVIDHATYVLASDGDLMEGVASEAASLAGHLRLGKLTCLYADHRVTLAAGTDITFSGDRAKRFETYGWHTVSVADSGDLAAIDAARANAWCARTSAMARRTSRTASKRTARPSVSTRSA